MTRAALPPVTDHLPISVRAYAEAGKPRLGYAGLAPSSWTLVFDTETTTDPGQALRFGTYQWRNGAELMEAGIFFEPEVTSTSELLALMSYTFRHGLQLRTRDEFVDEVFFGRAYKLRARVVGFNLPFDISRLAIKHGPARGAMFGGFTFTLSRQKYWPHVRVKHLSRRSALISFAAPMRQRDGRGRRRRGMRTPIRRGAFVDVNTLAAALFAQNFTLGRLGGFLKIENPKLEFDQFDGPITDELLGYAVRDVQATWECYSVLLKRLDQLGMGDLRPEEIYSEASIGKGYLREMGIAPWRLLQPDFPPELLGKIMASYYGGRSEIRIRRELRQVILCDFLSMYPTVCTLMGLWRFVIGDGVTWRDATAETRTLLDTVTLADLQSPATWPRLAALVQVSPDADIFPVRATYDGEAQSTIGANYLSSDKPLRFTLADCVASKLLTGKVPRIVEAIAFEPGPPQANLCPINISGNAEYRVDPVETDFFKRVIELRKETQARMKSATGDEREALDAEQHALKICANSTSYGIWVQVNVANRAERLPVTVHGSHGAPFTRQTDKLEKPGSYFHPLLASLITGAARLMLAITECQIEAQGLEWAFCDTDSMAIAKTGGLSDREFRRRVERITNWFAPLNPYALGGSILKIEGENFSLEAAVPKRLYCWAISSKRYALFNLSEGSPIMRKVSAHGLGHLRSPYKADDAPADIPSPPASVLRSGVERWHCDLWFQIVSAALAGNPDRPTLDFHPALSAPVISRYGATAPELLRWFDGFNAERPYRQQVKPFGFMLALSARRDWSGERLVAPKGSRGRPPKRLLPKPVAPFESDPGAVVSHAFDRETGEPVLAAALQSYVEALAQYHLHPESKFLGGDYCDRGTTRRRHIGVAGVRHIGKESNDWERQAMLGLAAAAEFDYGLSDDGHAQFLEDCAALAASMGKAGAAKALGISASRFLTLLDGRLQTNKTALQIVASLLPAGMQLYEKLRMERQQELERQRELVQLNGLREAARQLHVDPSNLRRRLRSSGCQKLPTKGQPIVSSAQKT